MHRQVDTSNLLQFPWGLWRRCPSTNYLFYTKVAYGAFFPYIYSYAFARRATNGFAYHAGPLVLMNQNDTQHLRQRNTTPATRSSLAMNLLVAPVITQPPRHPRTVYSAARQLVRLL